MSCRRCDGLDDEVDDDGGGALPGEVGDGRFTVDCCTSKSPWFTVDCRPKSPWLGLSGLAHDSLRGYGLI